MQGTNQLVRSNWGLGVLLRDTSTRPGWDRTANPPTARRQLLAPEPYCPLPPWGVINQEHSVMLPSGNQSVVLRGAGPSQQPSRPERIFRSCDWHLFSQHAWPGFCSSIHMYFIIRICMDVWGVRVSECGLLGVWGTLTIAGDCYSSTEWRIVRRNRSAVFSVDAFP